MILAAATGPQIGGAELPVVALGAALFLVWLVSLIRGREILPRGPAPFVNFRVIDVVAIFFAYVLLQTMLLGLAGGMKLGNQAVCYLFSFLGPLGITIAAFFLALTKREQHGPRAFGILAGAGAWLALFPVVALTLVGWSRLLELAGRPWQEQQVLSVLRDSPVPFFLTAVVLAPFCEEVLFRGLIFPALKRKIGTGLAMGISAGLFALVHWHIQTFPPLFLLGLGLAYLYQRTGTLAAPITLHAVFNGWTFLGVTLWS